MTIKKYPISTCQANLMTFAMFLLFCSTIFAQTSQGTLALERKDYLTALREFKIAAERGDPIAQLALGRMYDKGQGVTQDQTAAVVWYRKAADQGNLRAQFLMAYSYAHGEGLEKNSQEAVGWYRKAAVQGDSDSQTNLGLAYEFGRGVVKDPKEAVTWYRKAAEQGNRVAQFCLGASYMDGEGVEADPEQAVEWYRKAALQGHTRAQAELAHAYFDGVGVAQDQVIATVWYQKAAEQGDAKAQTRLDAIYRENHALRWRAAEKRANDGEAGGQFILGEMYRIGDFVAKNERSALYLLRKAEAQGYAKASASLKLLEPYIVQQAKQEELTRQEEQTRKNTIATEQQPKNTLDVAETLHNKAVAAMNSGNNAEAVRLYTQAIAISAGFDSNDRSNLYGNRGRAWYAAGDMVRALSDYNESIRIDPRNPWPFQNRSMIWWVQDGSLARTMADLKEAIRLDTKRETDAIKWLAQAEQADRENKTLTANTRTKPLYTSQKDNFMEKMEAKRKAQNTANCERALKGANVYCDRR